jgi:small-conductance mechanosensitive channel
VDFLELTFLDNPLRAWAVALGLTLVAFVTLRFVALFLARRLARAVERTRNQWDDIIVSGLGASRSSIFLVVALFIGATALTFPARWVAAFQSITIIALVIQGGLWLSAGLTAWLGRQRRERAEDEPAEVMTLGIIAVAVKIAIWSMVLLLALDNLGIDVTALVAGLGIGGVAVALAAQNILGDLFASLSIVLDKPFVLGDFVIVGDFLGSVEAIGLKTTRVRSLSGEQVVFSNTDLLSSRIRNYGRMYERRVVFKIGVTYQTPRGALEAIPGLVREAILAQDEELVRFDRSHMSSYGDFAIVFESVYYVLSPEFNLHMDIQQDIFLRIHAAFEERGIEFAYPTQTIWVERSGGEVAGQPT